MQFVTDFSLSVEETGILTQTLDESPQLEPEIQQTYSKII